MSYPHVKSFFLTWSLHNLRRIRLGPCPKLIFFTCSTQQEVVPTTINAPFDSGDAAAGGSRTQSSSFKTTWLHNSYICSAGHHTLLTLGSWQAKARLMSSLIAAQVYNVKWSSEGRLEKRMSENGKLYCNANYFHLSLPCHVFHTVCFCFATFMILWFTLHLKHICALLSCACVDFDNYSTFTSSEIRCVYMMRWSWWKTFRIKKSFPIFLYICTI